MIYKINHCGRLNKIWHFDPYGAMGSGIMDYGILSGLALCPQRRYSHWYFDNGLVTMALLPAAFWPQHFVPGLLTAGILFHWHFVRGIMSRNQHSQSQPRQLPQVLGCTLPSYNNQTTRQTTSLCSSGMKPCVGHLSYQLSATKTRNTIIHLPLDYQRSNSAPSAVQHLQPLQSCLLITSFYPSSVI